jgi:hypothetical protein
MATMHVIGISCHDLISFGKDPEVNDGFNGGGTNTISLPRFEGHNQIVMHCSMLIW